MMEQLQQIQYPTLVSWWESLVGALFPMDESPARSWEVARHLQVQWAGSGLLPPRRLWLEGFPVSPTWVALRRV